MQIKILRKLLRNPVFIFGLAVLVLFIFTRFYNLDKRIIFGWDQRQFSVQIREIVQNQSLTLLGPRVNNDSGFYLAPYLTYLLVPFYLISKLDPSILIFFDIIVNIAFFLATYFVISKIFSPKHALIILFLWTINPVIQNYDATPWWPLLIPIGVICTSYLMYRIYENNGSKLTWLLAGICLGFFVNMHFQFVFIVLFFSIFITVIKLIGKKNIRDCLYSMVGFLIMLIPLIVFDLRHNFLNSHLFFNFFFNSTSAASKDYLAWLPVFNNFISPLILVKSVFMTIVFYFGLLFCIVYLYRIRKGFLKYYYQSFIALWVIFPVLFILYGVRPSEYYFLFLFPIILLIIADTILFFRDKRVAFVICGVLLVSNFGAVFQNTKTNYGGLYYKDQVVHYIASKLEDKRFAVSYDGVSVDHGFDYLFALRNVSVSSNMSDPLVEISVPPRKNTKVIGLYGVLIPSELRER